MTHAYIIDEVNPKKFVANIVLCDGFVRNLGRMLDKNYTNADEKVHKLMKLGDMYSVGASIKSSPLMAKFGDKNYELDTVLDKLANTPKQYETLHDEAYSDFYSIACHRDQKLSLNKTLIFSSYNDLVKHLSQLDAGYFYLYQNHHWYDIMDSNLGDLTHSKLTIKQAFYDTKHLKQIRKKELPLRNQNLVNNIKLNIIWLKNAKVSRENIAYRLNKISFQDWALFCDISTGDGAKYFKAYGALTDHMHITMGKVDSKLSGAKNTSAEKQGAIKRLIKAEMLVDSVKL